MLALGNVALHLLVAFAGFAIFAALRGALLGQPSWVETAERAAHACLALVVIAAGALVVLLLGDRFDVAFVAQISSREQPWPFKLAFWGGQAGSLVLWAFMLALFGSLVVLQNRRKNRLLVPWVIASIHANLLFFAVLLAFISNPFELVPAALRLSNGQGMNPLLQHPVMLIHPPILYVGFVGFVVPFSFALAALVTGELGTNWFRTTRRWTLVAWCFLGSGIMLGGRWAYEVLGWGGYWAWDPVENASLMPWLAATAYLHSVMIQEKRGMLKVWNLVLIGLTYALCLFGTFLTRSGVVQSVHSFANAGWFGALFLFYVLAISVVFTACLVYRLPELRSETRLDAVVSREAGFLLNNYAFLGLLMIVLFGTLYPVLSEWISGSRVQIGPPFFQRFAGPIAIFLLFLTGVGPLVAWRRATLANLRKNFAWPAAVALVALVGLLASGMRAFYPLAFLTLCAFVTGTISEEYARAVRARMRHGEGPLRAFFELYRRNQRRYAGYVVHLAVVLIFVGFSGAAFELESTRLLAPGERWELERYTLEYRGPRPVKHPHYAGAVARLALFDRGEPVTMLEPEKRVYFQQEQPTTLPAVSSRLGADVYVILTGLEPDQSAALKVYVNPLVNWVWIGGFVFVIGNTLLLWRVPGRSAQAP